MTVPLHVSDFRSRYAKLIKLFSDAPGLLELVYRFKIPVARESFTEAYVSHGAEMDVKKRIFLAAREACRHCGTSPGKEQFNRQLQESRTCLTDAFIPEMQSLRVIRETKAPGRESLEIPTKNTSRMMHKY